MTKDEVKHLAKLSRIELSEAEVETFTEEMSAILAYVGQVKDIVAAGEEKVPVVGLRHNIFRKDEVTNTPDEFTKDILAEMPKTEGRYMVVKKILNTDS
jgi:aspartyl-tRNA(Asn)/glutamyl-tRNA(Gln) amidotransferase subunit C